MKSFEQLAESAYDAFWKEHQKALPGLAAEFPMLPWSEIAQTAEKNFWVAAVKQVAAEISAIH